MKILGCLKIKSCTSQQDSIKSTLQKNTFDSPNKSVLKSRLESFMPKSNRKGKGEMLSSSIIRLERIQLWSISTSSLKLRSKAL